MEEGTELSTDEEQEGGGAVTVDDDPEEVEEEVHCSMEEEEEEEAAAAAEEGAGSTSPAFASEGVSAGLGSWLEPPAGPAGACDAPSGRTAVPARGKFRRKYSYTWMVYKCPF